MYPNVVADASISLGFLLFVLEVLSFFVLGKHLIGPSPPSTHNLIGQIVGFVTDIVLVLCIQGQYYEFQACLQIETLA